MLPDRVSNPGPLTYESGALPIALRGPALPELQHYQSQQSLEQSYAKIHIKPAEILSQKANW